MSRLNYIKVPLQGSFVNTPYEYLRRVNRSHAYPQADNREEPTLLSSIKAALRGHNVDDQHIIRQQWLADEDNPDGRELSWTAKEVVLSMGGVIVKKWSFLEDREDIQTATLGLLEQNAVESKKWFTPSPNYASVADDEAPSVATHDTGRPVFGPFGAREERPRKFPDEREVIPAIFVFFRSVARIYLQNGMSYVISIPFIVRKAWPISPHGVMVQRILEPIEIIESHMVQEDVLPTIFTITSPLAEPAAVGLVDSISGGIDGKPIALHDEHGEKEILRSVPPTEMVLFVSQGNDATRLHRKSIVVTLNTEDGKMSTWRYAYAKSSQDEPSPPPVPPSSTSLGKKRQSLGSHNRRTSAAFEGDRLDSKHHVPPKDPIPPADLASLGAAASMGIAASMPSIITSNGSSQSSIPDKIAIEGTSPIPTADERMKSNYWMERVYTEQLTPHDLEHWRDLQVVIWDERWDGSCFKSHLGVVSRHTATLNIYYLGYGDDCKLTVTFQDQHSCISAVPILASRPKIYDCLCLRPNGMLLLLVQGTSPIGFQIIDPARPITEIYISAGVPMSPHGLLAQLEDSRNSLVTVVYQDGWRERINMDMYFKDKLVAESMQLLSFVLPPLEFYLLHADCINEWFRRDRVPDPDVEFESFKVAVYRLLHLEDEPLAAPALGLERLSRTGVHERFREDPALRRLKLPPKASTRAPKPLRKPPHPMHSMIMFTLHILGEDLRILKDRQDSVIKLAPLIARLALPVRPEWTDYWKRLVPECFNELAYIEDRVPIWPQDITSILFGMLAGSWDSQVAWTTPWKIAKTFGTKPCYAHDMLDPLSDLHELLSLYGLLADPKTLGAQKRAEATIQRLVTGIGVDKLDMLPLGIAAPLREALRTCQLAPPADWPLPSYSQIGRNDLAASASEEPEKMFTEGYKPAKDFMNPNKRRFTINEILTRVKTAARGEVEIISGVELGQEDFTNIRFGSDRRLEEVARLLNSSTLPVIKVQERAELSELDQTKEHQSHVIKVVERTLALPFGRAMFTFGSIPKVTREAHTIPKIEYSIKILPMNIIVQPEFAKFLPEVIQWGEFHNGVAAGLRIGPLAKGVESSWITFNKPSELTPDHAGFLFALGLTGHLKELMTWHTFQYLTPKHDQTSIAILLGLSASNIGKGTQKVVKLLAVHTPALLPTPDVDLNVHLQTQAAGLSGLGLLYLGMRNRRMAEVCLSEISRKDLVQPDLSNEHREAYTFSAAIAFGMVMLGKGSNIPADLELLQRLNTLVHGDIPSRLKEKNINPFDINLTSPAAAIALGLFYLKTERQDVADILVIPDTSIALNRIQPNFLMIRTIARALIMWDKIHPSQDWVLAQIPENIRTTVDPFKNRTGEDAFELAFFHISAGSCFAIGLKYAGTARQEAYSVIVKYYDLFSRLAYSGHGPAYDQKIKRAAVRDGLNQISLALCMIMAGTGEISCLRRIRFAYGVFHTSMYHPNFRFGVHLATMQSLGLLFLGAGRYTLGTSDAAIACMVAAFFPRPHVTPADNKSYLQALRHLWVLAVEPRCLAARDVDTGEVVYLPVKITSKEPDGSTGTAQLISPTLIPEINKIQSIRVDTPRYWPFYLDTAGLARHRDALLRNQTLFVKRRTAFLSYTEDPRGSRSLFVRSGSSAGDAAILDFPKAAGAIPHPASDLSEFITSFSNNVVFLAWADHLCRFEDEDEDEAGEEGENKDKSSNDPERVFPIYCHAALLDCIMQDKPETLQTHLSLYFSRSPPPSPSPKPTDPSSSSSSPSSPSTYFSSRPPTSKYYNLLLHDLRFAAEFYCKLYDRRFSGRQEANERPGLVRETAVMGALETMKGILEHARSKGKFLRVLGRYARGEEVGDLRGVGFEPASTPTVVQDDFNSDSNEPQPSSQDPSQPSSQNLTPPQPPSSPTLRHTHTLDLDHLLALFLLVNNVPASTVLAFLRKLAASVLEKNHNAAQLAEIEAGVMEIVHLAGSKMTNYSASGWAWRSAGEVVEAWRS